MQEKRIDFESDGTQLAGCVLEPRTGMPGILFVHGWAGSQTRDIERARTLARLGCVCLTFDMRGHGADADYLTSVTREENLHDIGAAYDRLAAHPLVDASSIAVVGSSYGGYLATVLTAEKPVRWLALRVPALYRDSGWDRPKSSFSRDDLRRYRSELIDREENLALEKAMDFTGDVLIVESETDDFVPHTTIASYVSAFVSAHSISYRVIEGADHALSTPDALSAYQTILVGWMREMIYGAR